MLAAEYALRGKRVLLIDSDSAGTASRIVAKPSQFIGSLADVLLEENPPAVESVLTPTVVEGLHLMASAEKLSKYEREEYRAIPRLRNFLHSLRRRYDFAFIDTPPFLGMLTSSAYAATNFLIVPVQVEPEARRQVMPTIKLVDAAKIANPRIKVLGALCTMYGHNVVSPQVYESLVKIFKGRTFKTVIPRQIRLCECPAIHLPIQLHAPRTSGAVQYAALADEILEILAGKAGKG